MKPLEVHPQDRYHPEMLARYNRDTAEHEMTVRLDQGLYRHLLFKKPGTSMYWFEIVTTPGQLTIRGDMGTYVFSRITDMADFFRGHVNAGYWAQKVEAEDKHSPREEYSEVEFKRFVLENFWQRREQEEPYFAASVWRSIRSELLYNLPCDSSEAFHALDEFNAGGWRYMDAWEHDFKTYSAQFLWCLHAIVGGLNEYRAMKAITEKGHAA